MDAQNAAEPASTKPAASPKRPGTDADHQTKPSSVAKPPSNPKSDSSKDAKDPKTAASSHVNDDDAAEGNSDAETIVLPGKDGHSPSKVRKIIKHEDRSDGEANVSVSVGRKNANGKNDRDGDKGERVDRPDKDKATPASGNGNGPIEGTPSEGGKKRKPNDKPRSKDASSGLSSAPASPPHHRGRAHNARSESDSETPRLKSPKASMREKSKSVDKTVSHKRKAPKAESDDEADTRKVRRQRTSGSGLDASRKQASSKSHHDAHPSSRTRSVSPHHHPRAHRRSISTQLPAHSSNGLSHKKKRVPAPLQSTDYHSDESSASGSPHPRSSKLRSLTTPATTESTISPAKLAPHKKHLDAHGQTFLARACAKGEYEIAKQRLQERPEDINVADYAGNTPLQIAAINGCDDIVKLLVEAGCSLDCVNNDKDTPLLDAVENGHLEVVRILLAAGVNPRKANAFGEEPIDRVDDDVDNAEDIRKALIDAKQRLGERRRTSEEHHPDQTDARSSHGPESPRRSPGASGSITASAATARRAGTVRSTKTSNHLLYMPMDDKTLRAAAGRGDEETVTRILQVRDTFDDPESMVAAARGGHDLVMQLLLALGSANPDPGPISSSEFSTPMLAAIGQENLKVVRLLLDQANFDPTRRFKGETYHEIARRRRGPNWMEEEHMLKSAYDEFRKSHKDVSKTKSPNRRDLDREGRRSRPEPRDESARAHKRKTSSPTRESKRTAPSKAATSPKEKRRSNSFSAQQDDQTSPKRGPGRPKKEDRIPTIAISDREVSPASMKLTSKAKRTESDMAAVSSEGESFKPRRKLISGRELKGERDKQRRASMTSNASSMKEPSSPHDTRQDDTDKSHKTEKYHRTKALKRDESRDRLSVSGESSGKRHRSSATPPLHGSGDKDAGEGPLKRRRLDADGKERRQKSTSSDDRRQKNHSSRDSPSISSSGKPRNRDDERRASSKPRKPETLSDHGRRESGKSVSSDNSIHVKSEDPDVDMRDAGQLAEEEAEAARLLLEKEKQKEKQKEEEKKKQAELEAKELEAKKEEERKRKEAEEKERLRQEEEAKRRAEEEKRQKEEEERKRKEEEERKRREEDERRQREEEERKLREAEEQRRREEEERLRKEEEEKKRKEEEERQKREEEERLRKEQLEREAAEEARRKREEEERREQERRRAAREAERAAREAEQRRIFLEMEQIRLSKLPPLLRWLDGCANPKLAEIAERFSVMQGVRYDCIRPEATGTPDGREQWLLNTQVALLLGEKDLELSRYTGWDRVPVSPTAKRIVWRLEADRYALTTPGLYDLGRQIPDYYGEDPENLAYKVVEKLRGEAWEKFASMDMFFIKASELMFIIPTIQHLRNVKLTMAYRELPESESQLNRWMPLQKWKNDPDANRFYGFAPANKYFMNGELIHEQKPGLAPVSTCPFPEKPVPRRGLVAVSPDDPDYVQLCKEQGLEHLITGARSPLLSNGIHASRSASHGAFARQVNGVTSPASVTAVLPNGTTHHPMSPSSESGIAQPRPLVNGIFKEAVNGVEG